MSRAEAMNGSLENFLCDVQELIEPLSPLPFTDRENAVLNWMRRNKYCAGEAADKVLRGRGFWPIGAEYWQLPMMTHGQMKEWRALNEDQLAADRDPKRGCGGPITEERNMLFEKLGKFAHLAFDEDIPLSVRKNAGRIVDQTIYNLVAWAIQNDWSKRTEEQRNKMANPGFDPLEELLKPKDAPLSAACRGDLPGIHPSLLDAPTEDCCCTP
jgi:hypothetical protein